MRELKNIMESLHIKVHESCLNKNTETVDFDTVRANSVKLDEEKRKKDRIDNIIKKIPPRFQEKSFSDYKVDHIEQGKVKQAFEKYFQTFSDRLIDGTCLTLVGKPGTGKSLLSFMLYRALAEAGFSVAYEPSLNFLNLLQEKKFESHGAFQSVLEAYKRISLLIIDEVTEGTGKGGYLAEWERQMLFNVIDTRYQNKLCTIVISNRNKTDLIDRLGIPIVDRLSEKGMTLAFTWNSYRQ